MPRARPLITTTPARASSRPSCSATASPYGDGRREPTMATRGPSGGGQRPRARSSGGDILQPEPEGFEDVLLFDLLRAVEVGRGPRHPPGAVKTTRCEPTLSGPALQRSLRARRKRGQLAEPRRLQLRVEHALAMDLSVARQ